jgi:hypothetical protein
MSSFIICTPDKILLGCSNQGGFGETGMGEIISACKILILKPERKRHPGRYKRRCEDNTKM